VKKKLLKNIFALGIIVLFIGIGIHPAFAVKNKTSSDSNTSIFENEKCLTNPLNQDTQETFGCFQGLIVGRISMLQGYGHRVKFWASSIVIISGILFPQRTYLNQRWVELDKPYLGILRPTFICVIGTIYSGW